jgi:urea transporter
MLLAVLRGFGQVMFQRNAVTGILFLAGMAVASPWLAVGAAIGGVIGTLVAAFLNLGDGDIQDGIYGFNSALVGVAAVALLPPTAVTWGLAAAAAAVAAPLTWLLRRQLHFPTYTAPFVLATWGMLLAAGEFGDKPLPPPAAPAVRPGWEGFAEEVLAGVAEVMFSASALSGGCFLAGIAVSCWRQAVVAVLGAVLGTVGAMYHSDPSGPLALGMYGYNAALAAMAAYLARPSLVPAALAALASVPLVEFFPTTLGVPALTAPFIMAAWIVLAFMAVDAALGQRAA